MPRSLTIAHRSGFTPVGLLVVITIIALLTHIPLPAFAVAREKARSTSCLSNLRQLGQAETIYIQDYDETFGSATISMHLDFPLVDPITAPLQPYLKNRQVLYGPDRSDTGCNTDDNPGGTCNDLSKAIQYQGARIPELLRISCRGRMVSGLQSRQPYPADLAESHMRAFR